MNPSRINQSTEIENAIFDFLRLTRDLGSYCMPAAFVDGIMKK